MKTATFYQRIMRKLTDDFAPIHLEIKDDSKRHEGHHPEFAGMGETHFIVTLVSAAFTGISRIERHRLVYTALHAEMQEHVHALVLNLFAPDEYNHR